MISLRLNRETDDSFTLSDEVRTIVYQNFNCQTHLILIVFSLQPEIVQACFLGETDKIRSILFKQKDDINVLVSILIDCN